MGSRSLLSRQLSRQSIHQFEKRIQCVPTWLVAIAAFLLLSTAVVLIQHETVEPVDSMSINKVLRMVLSDAEAIALAIAVILYVRGAPDRKTQKHYEAWRVIDTAAAANVTTSYARYQALQDLHYDGVPLKWLEAPKANLAGISLPKANLQSCNLAGTNLEGANLRGANLAGANLAGANLNQADLVGSDLTSADLRAATLRGTVLWDAKLWETNFANAEMRWAEVHQAQLKGAKLSKTVLPDGQVWDENAPPSD